MRNFASTLVKFSKLSHIQTTIWRLPKMAPPPPPPPPRTGGSAGAFVTPLPSPIAIIKSNSNVAPVYIHFTRPKMSRKHLWVMQSLSYRFKNKTPLLSSWDALLQRLPI